MLIPWSAEPLRNALLWIWADASWNVGSTICPISWKLCMIYIRFVTGLRLIALERFLACWSLVKTLPICALSLSSFGPDRFLSVSLSVSGLAGRLNQRRELGCFVKSELQGGHKLRYNFPCGQFQVNSDIGMLWKISCWFCDYYNEEIAGHQIVATNGSATKLVCLMSTELAFKGHAMLCREYFETKNSCWRRIRSDF